MYYPIGWHKVLNVDTQCDQEKCNILSVQANHERKLFFILTTKSIHIWNPRPAVEIVCHRRSKDSIESIGLNRAAVWRTDSSVIVVATDRDQLLFYQVRRRSSASSATSFLLPGGPPETESIYRLRNDTKNLKTILDDEAIQESSLHSASETEFESVPALTIFSFGKLDLSSIGVSCLMSAQEELIIGARNGNMYGIHWNGNVDNKFPWSLSKEIEKGTDYLIDLKFSSVLSGFVLVFYTGRVGFMPLKSNSAQRKVENGDLESSRENIGDTHVSYFADLKDAVCAEINHKYRLVAIGTKSSRVFVCNINDSNSSLVLNHKLELPPGKFPHDSSKLGPIRCMRYSPDSFALVIAWQGGDLAIWSVFGSLLFCTQQWQLESQVDTLMKPVKISCLAWGREGYNLWLSTVKDKEVIIDHPDGMENSQRPTNGLSTEDKASKSDSLNEVHTTDQYDEEILIMPLAHSTLSSSPHLTCSSDSIVLISEDKLYVGPSVPHEDKFDHWFVIDIPQTYLNINYPIRYATVDRECKNLAIAGNKGFALYSIETSKWKFFSKKSHETNISVCGDLICWKDYLVISCYNLFSESFEIRAYLNNGPLSNEQTVVQTTPMEVIRMSIFENRLLVLYSDGTLGMFMLNLRKRPSFIKPKSIVKRSNSIVDGPGGGRMNDQANDGDSSYSPKSTRSDSIMSLNYPLKRNPLFNDTFLQISPIENLVISNLQANAYCISSIALTSLHFKNNRTDDSILLNACGKLFLLEREAPPNLSTPSPTSDLSIDLSLNDLPSDSQISKELDSRVSSAKRLSNSIHLASATLKTNSTEPSALSNVTFKAVSVIATNVEQFWISPEISNASDMSYFKKSLWLSCGGSNNRLQVWLPLLNDKNDPPTDLYVPDRIMLPIRCDIYPLAIRSSAPDVIEPDDAIVLGAESDILYKDSKMFTYFPYSTIKRQCRVYLHRILRELLLNQHLGYYARKIAESCQSLPYFSHCFELLLHEVLEEEATSPVPLPDPMLPQIVRFIKEFPVYLETVVHCARKSELSMWSHLFDERAVGNPRRLFQECLEKHKLDTAASCLIILQSLDRNIVSHRMVKELIKAATDDPKYNYLIEDLENFLFRAELDFTNLSGSGSPNI